MDPHHLLLKSSLRRSLYQIADEWEDCASVGITDTHAALSLLFLDQLLMFLGNLLPEIGVHVLDPLFRPGDLLIVDIANLDVVEGPDPVCKFDRLLCIGTRGALDLILGCNGIQVHVP